MKKALNTSDFLSANYLRFLFGFPLAKHVTTKTKSTIKKYFQQQYKAMLLLLLLLIFFSKLKFAFLSAIEFPANL